MRGQQLVQFLMNMTRYRGLMINKGLPYIQPDSGHRTELVV